MAAIEPKLRIRAEGRNSESGLRTPDLPWANSEEEEMPGTGGEAAACCRSESIKGGERLAEIYCDGGVLSLSWRGHELVQLLLLQLLLLLLRMAR